jgi:hypothetical protein
MLVTWLAIVRTGREVLAGATTALVPLGLQPAASVPVMLLIVSTRYVSRLFPDFLSMTNTMCSNSCRNLAVVVPLLLASKLDLALTVAVPAVLLATSSRGSVDLLAVPLPGVAGTMTERETALLRLAHQVALLLGPETAVAAARTLAMGGTRTMVVDTATTTEHPHLHLLPELPTLGSRLLRLLQPEYREVMVAIQVLLTATCLRTALLPAWLLRHPADFLLRPRQVFLITSPP